MLWSAIGLVAAALLFVEVSDVLDTRYIAIAGTRTDHKVVALTFDHSWGNKYTPSILDTLKSNNVRATFFIMGPWAKKYPEVARRMVADGHEIGSHGFRHENYADRSADWVREDIRTAQAQIKEVTGVEPNLIRPPNGSYSRQSLQVAGELGCRTIIWNVDSLDWKNPGREVIVDRVIKRLKPGAIILMHASDTPTQTAAALPEILERIRQAGYQMVTVGELLANYSEHGLQRH